MVGQPIAVVRPDGGLQRGDEFLLEWNVLRVGCRSGRQRSECQAHCQLRPKWAAPEQILLQFQHVSIDITAALATTYRGSLAAVAAAAFPLCARQPWGRFFCAARLG